MVRQKFDQEWKDAFEGAELEPSDMVWTNVELELEKDSGGKMKRRLLFFQLLAAASMVFAMGISSVYFLNGSESTFHIEGNSLAQSDSQTKSSSSSTNRDLSDSSRKGGMEAAETQSSEEASTSLEAASTEEHLSKDTNSDGNGRNTKVVADHKSFLAVDHTQLKGNRTSNDRVSSSMEEPGTNFSKTYDYNGYKRRQPSLIVFNNPVLKIKPDERDPGEELLARLAAEERMLNKEDKKDRNLSERIWTSVGFGAGTFNPNTAGSSTVNTMGLASSGTPSSSNPTTGSSYSVGVSVGAKLTNRFVLQGGISYLTQNSQYTSSASAGDKVTLNEFSASNDKTIASSPYKVNSNLQFVSIPVQAGYIVLDRAFAIQLNGGFSTDLFLLGTLTPEDTKLEEISQGPGSDSPYRPVNFSGLIGSEFSYRFSDRYRIAVNPGLRYTLDSIYKSDIPAEVSPVTFDVSLKFRYIFH